MAKLTFFNILLVLGIYVGCVIGSGGIDLGGYESQPSSGSRSKSRFQGPVLSKLDEYDYECGRCTYEDYSTWLLNRTMFGEKFDSAHCRGYQNPKCDKEKHGLFRKYELSDHAHLEYLNEFNGNYHRPGSYTVVKVKNFVEKGDKKKRDSLDNNVKEVRYRSKL